MRFRGPSNEFECSSYWPIKDVSFGRRLMYGIQVGRIKQQSERPNLNPEEEIERVVVSSACENSTP